MSFVIGTGGFAREVDWLLNDVHIAGHADYRTAMFVAEDDSEFVGATMKGKPVISESQFLADHARPGVPCFIAAGLPGVRRKIVEKLLAVPGLLFPSVVHPTVQMDRRPGAIEIGAGSIVCGGSILTTDIVIGRFVQINLDCTIGR